jgi:hypothetical protein
MMQNLVISLGMLAMLTPHVQAQQPMGTVATRDALVTGGLEVQGDRARLLTNASVTAHERTADIALARGGDVLVCSTSEFHLLRAGAGQALLFGLDRGALELHTRSDAKDVILTPDIRFTPETAGEFDLRLRVTRNGDTCVENAGKGSPVLVLNAAFGGASYRLMPGQHVLFEHGDLRQVVDHERTECGCPNQVVLAANATPAQRAAAAHPFPEAEAEGLAPVETPANDGAVGEKQTQITGMLAYGPGAGPPPVPAADASVASPPPHEQKGGFFHSVGRFFHKLFHTGD